MTHPSPWHRGGGTAGDAARHCPQLFPTCNRAPELKVTCHDASPGTLRGRCHHSGSSHTGPQALGRNTGRAWNVCTPVPGTQPEERAGGRAPTAQTTNKPVQLQNRSTAERPAHTRFSQHQASPHASQLHLGTCADPQTRDQQAVSAAAEMLFRLRSRKPRALCT